MMLKQTKVNLVVQWRAGSWKSELHDTKQIAYDIALSASPWKSGRKINYPYKTVP